MKERKELLNQETAEQVRGAAETIAEALQDRPECELYLYDGYGHAVYDLAPDYKQRMLNFFTRER